MKTDTATAQHTPGPWSIDNHHMIVAPDATSHNYKQVVATVYSGDGEQLENNLRLIAAAPDLLKALLELEDSCFHVCGPCQPTQKAIDTARAAIAKATA